MLGAPIVVREGPEQNLGKTPYMSTTDDPGVKAKNGTAAEQVNISGRPCTLKDQAFSKAHYGLFDAILETGGKDALTLCGAIMRLMQMINYHDGEVPVNIPGEAARRPVRKGEGVFGRNEILKKLRVGTRRYYRLMQKLNEYPWFTHASDWLVGTYIKIDRGQMEQWWRAVLQSRIAEIENGDKPVQETLSNLVSVEENRTKMIQGSTVSIQGSRQNDTGGDHFDSGVYHNDTGVVTERLRGCDTSEQGLRQNDSGVYRFDTGVVTERLSTIDNTLDKKLDKVLDNGLDNDRQTDSSPVVTSQSTTPNSFSGSSTPCQEQKLLEVPTPGKPEKKHPAKNSGSDASQGQPNTNTVPRRQKEYQVSVPPAWKPWIDHLISWWNTLAQAHGLHRHVGGPTNVLWDCLMQLWSDDYLCTEIQSPQVFQRLEKAIAESNFLLGKTQHGFQLTLTTLLGKDQLSKVLSGKYANFSKPGSNQDPVAQAWDDNPMQREAARDTAMGIYRTVGYYMEKYHPTARKVQQ